LLGAAVILLAVSRRPPRGSTPLQSLTRPSPPTAYPAPSAACPSVPA
jgi:hypothetical protein